MAGSFFGRFGLILVWILADLRCQNMILALFLVQIALWLGYALLLVCLIISVNTVFICPQEKERESRERKQTQFQGPPAACNAHQLNTNRNTQNTTPETSRLSNLIVNPPCLNAVIFSTLLTAAPTGLLVRRAYEYM